MCILLAAAGWAAGVFSLEGALVVAAALGSVGPAAAVAGWARGRRAMAIGAVVTPIAWYSFHRTANEMSWVALLPLAVALGAWHRLLLRLAVRAYVFLNLLLAILLQGLVRPIAAREFFALPAAFVEALAWLDGNTAPDSVVVTNSWASDYLVRAYTHDLGLSAVDRWSNTSSEERQRRQGIRSAIYQVPPTTIERLLAGRAASIATFKANVNERWIGNADMDTLVERQGVYHFTLAEYDTYYAMPLPCLLSAYQADYVWVGPWEREVGQRDFQRFREMTLVFENQLIQIYRIEKEQIEAQADHRHPE